MVKKLDERLNILLKKWKWEIKHWNKPFLDECQERLKITFQSCIDDLENELNKK